MENFKKGDVVKLKSGGPAMTLNGYDPKEGGKAVCVVWFTKDNQFKSEWVDIKSLRHVSAKEIQNENERRVNERALGKAQG